MERAKEYLVGFGLSSVEVRTVEEWEFLNAHGFWVKANPNSPQESARNNAEYFGTNRTRYREVTYTEWVEQCRETFTRGDAEFIASAPADIAYLLGLLQERDEALVRATDLIRDLTDAGECWFDHHGGCQQHGYLTLEPGQTCPQHDAKEWARAAVAAANGDN